MRALFANKFLLLILAAVVAVGLWIGLSSPSTSDETLLSSENVTGTADTDPAGQEVVETLLALRAITLDGSIFSDPAFASLRDTSTDIVQEPVGRPNPFAPLDGVVVQPPAPIQAPPESTTPVVPKTPPPGGATPKVVPSSR